MPRQSMPPSKAAAIRWASAYRRRNNVSCHRARRLLSAALSAGPDDTASRRQSRHRPSMPTPRPSVSPDVRTLCLICVIERLGDGWRHGGNIGPPYGGRHVAPEFHANRAGTARCAASGVARFGVRGLQLMATLGAPLVPPSPSMRLRLKGRLAHLQLIADSDIFRILFAAAVLLAAVFLLRRELQGSSLAMILAALHATAPSTLLLAAAATAASYACLAVSEDWALANIGQRLAPWRIAIVTFVAYALSNGLGFSLATGGGARLRIYRSWGMTSAQIGVVTVLAGVAVSVSGLVTAGLAILFIPGTPGVVTVLGVAMVTPAVLWLMRWPRRAPAMGGTTLRSPPLNRRLLALAGGVADWLFSGLALFVLLPGAGLHDFAPFLAIFVLGSIVSSLAGVPGGVGVFDAIVLTLSRRFSMAHETAAALVLYRLIYAVAPLLITAVGLAIVQARRFHHR